MRVRRGLSGRPSRRRRQVDTGYPYPGLPVEQVLVVTTFVGCVGINDSRIIPLGTMED